MCKKKQKTKKTGFQFKDNFYIQRCEMGMDSSLSPILCNIFITTLEQEAMASARHKLDFCLRYADDTFVPWKHGTDNIDQSLSHINSLSPTLQFTCQWEKTLLFLDVKFERIWGKFRCTVHRNKHTAKYIHAKIQSRNEDQDWYCKSMVEIAKCPWIKLWKTMVRYLWNQRLIKKTLTLLRRIVIDCRKELRRLHKTATLLYW